MKRGTPEHPKTRALARALAVPLAQAVGHLEMLWHWTARFAPTGAVGRFGASVIAESCAWQGDPDVLIAAMTGADSRWLDTDEQHGLIVHDWPQHADDAVHRQLARSGTRFANGDVPRLTRLSTEERKEAEAAFKKGARRAPKVRLTAPGVRPAVAVAVPLPGHAVAVPGPAVADAVAVPADDDGTSPDTHAQPEPLLLDAARCPDCHATGTLRRGKGDGGWFCGTKLGGCNAQFRLDDPAILVQLGSHARASIETRVARAPANGPAPGRHPTAAETTVAAVRQIAVEAEAKRRR